MTRRVLCGFVCAAAACLTLAGCATGARLDKHARAGWPPVAKPDAETEAHARYADGVIAESKGDLAAAMDSFSQAVAKAPADEDLALDVVRRFLQYRQPARALQILTNAVAQPHASGALFAQLGLVYAQLGETDLAFKANQAAVQKAPNLIAAHQALYLTALQAKKEDQALQALENAATAPDADAEFLVAVAEMYSNFGILVPTQRTNAHARARALLGRADTLNPGSAQTRLKLADGFNILGESTRAIELYRRVLGQPDLPPPLRNGARAKLADLCLRTGDRKGGAQQLEALLRDDPMNAQANYILGNIALDDQRLEAAVDYFSRAVLLSPKFEQAHYDLASAQISAGRVDAALATLEQARARFQQTFLVEYLTGVAYSRRKEYVPALKHYTAAEVIAKATDPDRLTYGFYFQLGVACERSGDFDTAAKHFEKCLELAPRFAEAQNYLGYMWAERGTNLDRARGLIEQAVKAEPENGAFLDSLGWVLFKLGKPREALEPMERALKHVEEPDPTLYDHLGDIQAALGNPEKAREAWRKSLELEPNDAIQKKLDEASPK
jgi:tetratricopeptide (TPR) repeat protein